MKPPAPLSNRRLALFATPQFTAALTTAIVGTELLSLPFTRLIGWPGLLGIVATLVVLAALSLVAKSREIEWNGLLPLSLLVFVGWAGLSLIWSEYQWATLGSFAYFGAVTTLGIYVALARDTIQIARAFGDVLRFGLIASLVFEIFSGLLVDTPIRFLHIQGNLDHFGPLQGVFGTRNQLGIIALVALVTFGAELRTKSVSRRFGIGSLVLAGLCLLLARSPVAGGALVLCAAAAAALYGLRRVRPQRRRFWQGGLLLAAIVGSAFAWALRAPIIDALSANSEIGRRLQLWQQVRQLTTAHELQGWGWVGHWRQDVPPFEFFLNFSDKTPTSALNAFLDVAFQLGLVGLSIFFGMAALTFVRSWLLASRQRSVVFAWPALVLVVLLSTAFAESSILVEFGWLTFVVCCVKASRELSWRTAFAATAPQDR